MSKSDYLENKLLDGHLGGPDYVRPASVFVAFFTSAPNDAGGGTEVDDADWTNYERAEVVNNATNWPAASGGAKSNGVEIDFGNAVIVTPVTLTHFAIFDDATAGNLLRWGALTNAPQTVNDGNPVKIPVGALDVTED